MQLMNTFVLLAATSFGALLGRVVLPGAKEAGLVSKIERMKENINVEKYVKERNVLSRCGAEMCTSASLCPDMVGLSKAARLAQLR